jgi:hypothetical protein
MSNHSDSSIEWYINWLAETRPDISPEQRVELATGFVQQQQPPVRPTETEEDNALDEAADETRKREEARAAERKNRKYLTGEELMSILSAPGEVKDTN